MPRESGVRIFVNSASFTPDFSFALWVKFIYEDDPESVIFEADPCSFLRTANNNIKLIINYDNYSIEEESTSIVQFNTWIFFLMIHSFTDKTLILFQEYDTIIDKLIPDDTGGIIFPDYDILLGKSTGYIRNFFLMNEHQKINTDYMDKYL